jgi:protoporphyrinogen oxidase
MVMRQKTAVIIGAGPAGLTAAYELLHKTDIKPIIFERTPDIGGISKTVNYKGNRIDIGGHRFFSKSDRVMEWWRNVLPVQGAPAKDAIKLNKIDPGRTRVLTVNAGGPDPERDDRVMLIRNRISRIFYLRKFFDYPISLSLNTLRNLGLKRVVRSALSLLKIRIIPINTERSLEDFFVNRFGRELYLTFFKEYTKKVWGVGCAEIKPEWGEQRIKGLSIAKALMHALRKVFSTDSSIGQKRTETTLIEQFLYPKFGPGQMWETVAQIIKEMGGEVYLHHQVVGLVTDDHRVVAIEAHDLQTNETIKVAGDYFFSTMAVKDLIASIEDSVSKRVRDVAEGLVYRDFVTVGLLLRKLAIKNETNIRTVNNVIPDNWIYIQESDVKVGRLQIFNNWSPYMVENEDNVWIGLEYFCNEGDDLWDKSDEAFSLFAINELAGIGFIEKQDVLDSKVIRMPKTYPAYFGTYDEFHVIREFTDRLENLFLIGRNGMHKYNNQDHSMLTAMTAVDNIISGNKSKDNIWAVNTEQEYHETK